MLSSCGGEGIHYKITRKDLWCQAELVRRARVRSLTLSGPGEPGAVLFGFDRFDFQIYTLFLKQVRFHLNFLFGLSKFLVWSVWYHWHVSLNASLIRVGSALRPRLNHVNPYELNTSTHTYMIFISILSATTHEHNYLWICGCTTVTNPSGDESWLRNAAICDLWECNSDRARARIRLIQRVLDLEFLTLRCMRT